MIGRIFGLAEGWQPGLRSSIGYAVGTAATIGIVWSVRTAAGTDAGFEVDHAMPQLLIPLVVFLIATGEAGNTLSRSSGARAAWSMVVIGSCLLAAITVVLTISSPLDAGSLLAIALASAYGASSIVHLLTGRSRSS